MNKFLLGLVPLVALAHHVDAQTRQISGRVTDRATGEGLPGATVLLKGTTTGVSTNSDGTFTLGVSGDGGTLEVSSLGYIKVERAIGTDTQINIGLATDSKQLTEVVVTGFGNAQERREVTGSIAAVKASDFKNQPIAGVDQALQGRAAGVQVTQSSGTPGSGISVRVRGAASLNASNEPLYVVDGLPINTGSYTNIGAGGQLTNSLSDINPNDIESIEVLKDASSAAIYGSRASNGVVLITTKRGKAGKTNITLDYYRGAQTMWKMPENLSGPDQVRLFLDQVENRYPRNASGQIIASNLSATPWRSYADLATYLFSDAGAGSANGQLTAVDNGDGIRDLAQFQNPDSAPNTDWGKEISRTSPITNYELTFSGGNDRTRFRVGAGYFDNVGTILGSGFKRASARLSLENSISDRVRMGVNVGLNRSVNNRIQNDNNINGVLSTAVLVASDIPKYRANGTYAKDPGASTENPLAAALEPTIKGVSARIIGSQFTEFDIVKGLKYRATFGLDYLTFKDDTFFPTTTNTGAGTNGSATSSYRQDLNWNHTSALSYNKTIGESHSLGAQLVAEYQQSVFNEVFASATGFPGNEVKQVSAGAQKTGASSSETEWRIFGLLGRANYSFRDKYLVSASVRRDGSSRFGANNRFGYFPAASVGWRVSEEGFLKGITALSDLKIRASYGQTGNQEIANFASRGLIGTGANFQQVGGLALSQLANPNLKWERTNQTNIGLDLGLFNNRVVLAVDAYQRDTRDLLQNRLLPGNTGFTSYQANVGSIENKGLEVALTTVNLRGESEGSFEWTTNFNIAFNRNKVTKLLDGTPFASGFANWVAEGQPLGAFRGYRVEKIFQSQEEINELDAAAKALYGTTATYQATLTRPGDIKFRDLNGDGRITGDDQEIIGSAQPDFYGGLTNTIRFKGFDFTAFIQYSVGNEIYNNNISFAQGMNGVFGQDKAVLNRWTPTNTNTDIPRAVYGDPNNNRRVSDRFIEDGSYARLKQVTLGYTLPKSVIGRVKLNSARVYVQAQNLITLTNYSGLDPEVNTFSGSNTSLGTDFLVYPQARTITGGISLGF
ncbi:SusC/RagA family TonB-linked outer membrane protein [Solirubrum puertoriconensis]|uniref:SusC/RagA family TonB-linked outer membrane protein n=1 Tax=Solirubrum puertoriconensis TaxID=1751427 RepID=UPI00098F18A3|nr:TonB-dependent receptor [Solirubrum puertoriconensis]